MTELNRTKVTERYDITLPTLNKRIEEGKIKANKKGGVLFITVDECEKKLIRRTPPDTPASTEQHEGMTVAQVDAEFRKSRAIKERELAIAAKNKNDLFALRYIAVAEVKKIFSEVGVEMQSAFNDLKAQAAEDLSVADTVPEVEQTLDVFYENLVSDLAGRFNVSFERAQEKLKNTLTTKALKKTE